MSTENLKTPEAPAWFSSLWNNPTMTTLSENVFVARLAEIKAMKWSVPDTTYAGMMKPFQEAFDTELKAGIAITSLADITRIEKMGLASGIDFAELKQTLTTLQKTDDDLGYFRAILKSDQNWQISFKKNNSWIGHDATSGIVRNFGVGNYGTAVSYEVDFSKFPKKDAFEIANLRAMIAKKENGTAIVPEVAKAEEKKQVQTTAIKEATKTEIASVQLPVAAGQKVLLKAQDLGKIAQLIDTCWLGASCKKDNILDVAALQNAIVQYKPTDYTGKKWDDGLFGMATYQALQVYAKANPKPSTQVA